MYQVGPKLGQLVKTFTFKKGAVVSREGEPLEHTLLSKLIIGLPRTNTKGRKELALIGRLCDDIVITEYFRWADGQPLFSTTMAHLRSVLTKNMPGLHVSIAKWERFTVWPLEPAKLWKEVWVDFRSAKHNTLLWQILYRSIATND